MAERDLYTALMLKASKLGARLFRNNTGMGWVGREGRIPGQRRGCVILQDARPLHAGLCKGSSDLIGWTPVKITPAMVGKTVAVFTAVELKGPRAVTTKEQLQFAEAVKKAGGMAYISHDPEGVLLAIKSAPSLLAGPKSDGRKSGKLSGG